MNQWVLKETWLQVVAVVTLCGWLQGSREATLLCDLTFNFWFASRTNGIFGKSLTSIVHKHPGPNFFFDWLRQIKQLHDLSQLEGNVQRYEAYFEFKSKINLNPTPLPDNVTDEFLYCAVRDFIKEETDTFLSGFSPALQRIDGKLSFIFGWSNIFWM